MTHLLIRLALVLQCEIMNKEINLVASKRKQSITEERTLQITQIVAIIVMVLVSVLSLLFFFLNQNSPLPQLKQQEESLISNITVLHPKIAQYLILKERLRLIDTVLSTRTSFDTAILQITQALPLSVTVSSFTLNQKTISLTLISPSLKDAETFVNAMTDKVTNKQLFKRLTIDNIIADEKSGKYTVLIDATPL